MDTKRDSERSRLRLGPQGRIVIPAAIRRALQLRVGDELLIRVEEGRLVLERREDVVRRLRERFAGVDPERVLSEELIAERREEAKLETRSEANAKEQGIEDRA